MPFRVLRPALAAGMISVVAAAGLAGAAPAKPSCNLITDDKGDTFAIRLQDGAGAYGPQENALDIVSGDIASDGKVLTAVLRVEKLANVAATSPNGLSFRVQFTHAGLDEDTNLFLSGRTSNTGTSFVAGSRAMTANLSTKLGDATGVFDVAKNEVRISAPLAVFDKAGKPLKKGSKIQLGDLDQTASRFVATNPQSGADTAVFADVTTSSSSYVIGAKSCVVPGK